MATRSSNEDVRAAAADHETDNPGAEVTEDGELLAPRPADEHVIFEEPPLG